MIGRQAPKPPFQFVIFKSVLYPNCGGDSAVLPDRIPIRGQ